MRTGGRSRSGASVWKGMLWLLSLVLAFHAATASDDAAIDALRSWMLKNGGVDTSHLDVRHVPAYDGYGVFAARRIAPGEEVISVPFSLMLTSQSCFLSEIGAAIRGMAVKTTEEELLAVCLLYQMHKRDTSFWRPYLDTLPREDRSLVSNIDEELLRELDGSSLKSGVAARRHVVLEEFNSLQSHLFSKHQETFSSAIYSQQQYFWARFIVDSRSWGLPGSTSALIPFADLFNHGPKGQHLVPEPDRQRSVLKADPRAGANTGEEIFDSYGAKSAGQFALSYGFVPETNERDWVVLNLAFGGTSVWDDTKRTVLTKLGYGNAELNGKLFKHKIAPDIMQFLRIAHLDPSEIEAADAAMGPVPSSSSSSPYEAEDDDGVSFDDHVGRMITLRNELAVLRDLIVKIDQFLDGYRTSVAEDDIILSKKSIGSLMRVLVRYRRAEKIALLGCKSRIVQYWDYMLHIEESSLNFFRL